MIVAAFLFPLAVYCLVLGLVNRRRHPLLVRGPWDFAGLLFAASGFLAFGLPGLLSGFSEYGREAVLIGPHTARHAGSLAWLWECYENLCATLFNFGGPAVLIGYFLLVVAASALLLWRRQCQTVIYNIHVDVFDEVLAGVCDAAGLAWSRAGPRYFISRRAKARPAPPDVPDAPPATTGPVAEPPLAVGERRGYPASAEEIEQCAYLEVDASPALCHVTLHWEAGDAGVRKQVEGDLVPALAAVRTRDNPMGGWLLAAGAAFLSAAAMLLVFAVLYRLYRR